MANMFGKNAADRKAEQKKIEKAVAEPAVVDEKRTTLSLSLTVSDKKAFKLMAMEQEPRLLQSSMDGFRSILRRWRSKWLETAR